MGLSCNCNWSAQNPNDRTRGDNGVLNGRGGKGREDIPVDPSAWVRVAARATSDLICAQGANRECRPMRLGSQERTREQGVRVSTEVSTE